MHVEKEMNILCAGECMLELRKDGEQFRYTFAGDVANFAIYLKRLLPLATVNFFSAVGNDVYSWEMKDFLGREGINLQLLFLSPEKIPGLYIVNTDAQGERIFTYWRSDSAAKKMFVVADQTRLYDTAATMDYFYFSGITLAILDQCGREALFELLSRLRKENKTIIFDPNFRKALWEDISTARTQTARAYGQVDILLSSCEDERKLFGPTTTEEILKRLQSFGVKELALTDGPDDIYGIFEGEVFRIASVKAKSVIDTTSAGDAFNAGYIAARHNKESPEQAIKFASLLASKVVGCAGAIMQKEQMPRLQIE